MDQVLPWMAISLVLYGYLAWQIVCAPLIDRWAKRHDPLPPPTLVSQQLRHLDTERFLR